MKDQYPKYIKTPIIKRQSNLLNMQNSYTGSCSKKGRKGKLTGIYMRVSSTLLVIKKVQTYTASEVKWSRSVVSDSSHHITRRNHNMLIRISKYQKVWKHYVYVCVNVEHQILVFTAGGEVNGNLRFGKQSVVI